MEPGRLPSTVDPDAVQPPEKEKKNHRPVRLSAWKLAKLDSNEAAKAAAKARASSSVLRPISSRPYLSDVDHLSGSNMSELSSPVSNQGFHNKNAKAGTSRSSPSKSSYPPSRASKDDTISNLSSPQHSNLTPSPTQQRQSSNRDHFNPMYQQASVNGSSLSGKESEGGNVNPVHVAMRNNSLAIAENRRSSVFWDQEAGRFVTSSGHSSSQTYGTELLYTGRSIFYGSPVVNEEPSGGTRNSRLVGGNVDTYGDFQQSRSHRVRDGLPVFVPASSQQSKFPSSSRR